MRKKLHAVVFVMLLALCTAGMTVVSYAEPESGANGETAEASSDNSLSSLRIAQSSLSPEFSPEQLTYTASVPYDVTRIALKADTNSPLARMAISGTGDLAVGENVVTVAVTAGDGSVREYRITVTREEAPEGAETIPPKEEETTAPEGTEAEPSQGEETNAAEGTGTESPGGEETSAPEGGEMESPEEGDTLWSQEETESQSGEPPIQTAPADSEDDGKQDGETAGTTGVNRTSRPKRWAFFGGNKLLTTLGICCVVVVLMIIAVLFLRRSFERDEDDEDEAELDEADADDYEDDEEAYKAAATDTGKSAADRGDRREKPGRKTKDDAVTPEELARFYHALNETENGQNDREASGRNGFSEDPDLDSLDLDDMDDEDFDKIDIDMDDPDPDENMDEDFEYIETGDNRELLEEDDDFDLLDF
ncbi:MAG: hypothetical protein HFI38_13745 [Lachnospiraceae bacterium]|nr:hypothetical protein [Lachnospiraceae bacterium]